MSVQPRNTAPQKRRNQAERSAATREALLDATLECLVEDGYANTTTARVAERAGAVAAARTCTTSRPATRCWPPPPST